MTKSLVVTDSRIWTAETEYAVSVAVAESVMEWDVTLAAPTGSAAQSHLDRGVVFEGLPGVGPGRSPSDFLADARFLAELISERRFDVVHSSGSVAHLLSALATGRRAPLVHLRGGARPPKRTALNRFLYDRMTSSVVVSSDRVLRWVADGLGVPRRRVHRILAPVDLTRFGGGARATGTRGALSVPESAPLIVNVARLAPVKGQHTLVDAMPDVLRRRPDAVLVLVGEAWSGEPEGLIRRTEDLGVRGAVVVAGRRDDVPALLAEASVCVCSSVGSEENSRAVSEYMAAGRPVVATRVGVIPELVEDGRSGLLVEPGDAPGLAAGIVRMLEEPDFAAAVGARARAFAEDELSMDAFAARIAAAVASGRG